MHTVRPGVVIVIVTVVIYKANPWGHSRGPATCTIADMIHVTGSKCQTEPALCMLFGLWPF